ncbi:ABC-type transport auxiliary lipoprotein family protein [Catenovulum sp. 2E275]|uniref:PqiC family protein n=1 Tax=Catenovulum sp. 2E275 TaxID=2980497 RepID=UPI0021D09110|nr:ABC-type transport auxiliary lipoprotein family protein [Catenovulum sp. 2E275]MCU4676010.1 ABC-type transport auxiliary lipoprotein family protein [Catenovulum sp. 2E275]
MKRKLGLLVVIFSCFLFGCASEPPQIKYYLLPYQSLEQTTSNIQLEINVAEYLKQDSLVIENEQSELTFAHYHRWAEPLELLIHRYMSKQLLKQLTVPQRLDKTKLIIEIERLYGSVNGKVYLSGYWWIEKHQTDGIERHYFNFQQPQLEAGYRSFVDSTADLLTRLASQVNHELN